MDCIATFPSSHVALRAERSLLDAGLALELIPVPRQIRSDCGFCLLVDLGPGAEAGRRLEAIRASGAREIWRVIVTQPDPSMREVKAYERLP